MEAAGLPGPSNYSGPNSGPNNYSGANSGANYDGGSLYTRL